MALLWLLLPVIAYHRAAYTVRKQKATALGSKARVSTPDSRQVKPSLISEGSLVEYVSSKGSRRLALVKKGVAGAHLDVMNQARKTFSVPISRVTYVVQGSFVFADLLRLEGTLGSVSVAQAQTVWEILTARNATDISTDVWAEEASDILFGSRDATRIFAVNRIMILYSSLFFERKSGDKLVPLPPDVVQENLRDREALLEFKSRYTRHIASKLPPPMAGCAVGSYASDRVARVIESYSEGLRQVVVRAHPWVAQGWARRKVDESAVGRGKELLEFLDLAPTVKNARSVLETVGKWSAHMNLEKHIMCIRDVFPQAALEEAQYLQDNAAIIPDPDERLRRDLRYLGCYAIDKEGAQEIDDAISIERLDDGREKIWVHIADVSRWVRPGSELSIEAEQRMLSVYMPDEKISLFPEALSVELLSLGAGTESFALSCGVVIGENGEIRSYEVCPSRIRITKRITYSQLDEILASEDRSNELGRRIANVPFNSRGGEEFSGFASFGFMNPAPRARTAPPAGSGSFDASTTADMRRLNYHALRRHEYRVRRGALDEYMRHKSELSLSVRKDKLSGKMSVTGYLTWSNSTSVCLVTEYMILMCETVGRFSSASGAPVWYKVQQPSTPLDSADLALREGESAFIRSTRITRLVRPALDSKEAGPHCSSGTDTYVQCTSPIRRYQDLYNHYRIKAALHGASLGEQWREARAKEEAGISLLDTMASADERMSTLTAVRMVSRQRQIYWLQVYIERLLGNVPRPAFDCIVLGEAERGFDDTETNTIFYDASVLQLGTYTSYKLFSNITLRFGDVVKCNLYKRYTNPASYVLLPEVYSLDDLPKHMQSQLTNSFRKNSNSL